jgi:hypothetical protein
MKHTVRNLHAFLILSLSCVNLTAFCQNATAPKYVSIAFIKSKSADFINIEKEQWVPVHRQLIRDGKKIAWYMYRVKYPTGTKKDYDYVRFNVFADWKQAEGPYAGLPETLKKIHPDFNADEFNKKVSASREIVWEQLHQVIDEAVITKTPSQYIIVNEVKTVPGQESEYVKMEISYFKPFHAERVSRGLMNNWSLYKLSLPYGEKYDHNYVTLNGYKAWEDITKNPPPSVWEKVHGSVNFNDVHSEILAKRITVNNEIWELAAYVTE